jgi:hypothetical protein
MLEDSSLLSTTSQCAWDEALLAPVMEINLQLLGRLHRLALLASVGNCHAQVHDVAGPMSMRAANGGYPALLSMLIEEWRALDEQAQQRLAACPYVLIDAGFGPGGPWEQRGSGASAAPATAPRDHDYFQGPEGIALLRQVLLLGWHLARSNHLAARLLFGMSGPAALRLGACSLQQLEALAEQRPPWMMPRWAHEPAIWQQLLRAACGGQTRQLRNLQLHGLQLLAATPH